jgi:hypothetical protein
MHIKWGIYACVSYQWLSRKIFTPYTTHNKAVKRTSIFSAILSFRPSPQLLKTIANRGLNVAQFQFKIQPIFWAKFGVERVRHAAVGGEH